MSERDESAAMNWLRTAKAPKDRAPEVVGAVLLLQGRLPATAENLHRYRLACDVEAALLQIAEADGRWDLVSLIATSASHKANQKSAKKVVFRAKARGIVVPEPSAAPRRAVALISAPDPLPSFASATIDDGSMVVALGGWSAEDGPWTLMGVLTPGDTLQLVHFHPQSSVGRVRQTFERALGAQTAHGEIPEALAAGLLRRGLDESDALRTPIEGDVARARRLLSAAVSLKAMDVALDAADEARLPELCEQAERWATQPAIFSWGSMLSHWVGRRASGDDEVQRLNGLGEDDRRRLAARLELAAMLLPHHSGADARLAALATARALRQMERAPASLPLVRRLLSADRPRAQPVP